MKPFFSLLPLSPFFSFSLSKKKKTQNLKKKQSTEVDYYKIKCNNEYRIVIPQNFSKATSDYLDQVTKRHNFSEKDGFINHDEVIFCLYLFGLFLFV